MSKQMTVAEYKERKVVLEKKYLAAHEEARMAQKDGVLHLWRPSDSEVSIWRVIRTYTYATHNVAGISIDALEDEIRDFKRKFSKQIGRNGFTGTLNVYGDVGFAELAAKGLTTINEGNLQKGIESVLNKELSLSLIPKDDNQNLARVINCKLVDSWVDGKIDTEALRIAVYGACDV